MADNNISYAAPLIEKYIYVRDFWKTQWESGHNNQCYKQGQRW